MFNVQRPTVPTAMRLDPFDISLYATTEGLRSLQTRFSLYLRGLATPARFIAFQTPADLSERIYFVGQQAARTSDAERQVLLNEYRRFYQILQAQAHYQRSECGLLLWTDVSETPASLARAAGGG